MSEEMLERKLQIYKIRVANLMEEHADALAQAQEVHGKLQDAQQKISRLEEALRNRDVQEKTTIIDGTVDATEN